jgi:hypothetical protein
MSTLSPCTLHVLQLREGALDAQRQGGKEASNAAETRPLPSDDLLVTGDREQSFVAQNELKEVIQIDKFLYGCHSLEAYFLVTQAEALAQLY